jgi:FkbM family methyltransferase
VRADLIAARIYGWYFRNRLEQRRGGWRVLRVMMWVKPIVPIVVDGLPPVWLDLPSANEQVVELLKCPRPYEAHLQALFRRLIRPTDTVIDVGANLGLHSVLFDTLAARVVAFEPHPLLHNALRRTIGGLRHTSLVECALADFDGIAPFVIEGDHTAGALSSDGEPVVVRRLDDVLRGDPVHFMKIDVEGHEIGVLRGAEKTIRRDMPIIVYEQLRRAGSAAHGFLHSLGYQFRAITRSGEFVPWGIEHEWCDVLAVPAARTSELAGIW